jgi:thioredoxin 1
MAEVAEVTDQNFEVEVLNSDRPVIIDFWAEWCSPCRAIAPIIKELAEQYGDRVKIAKIDVQEYPNAAGQYGVTSIPTVLAFKDGRVVEQLTGVHPKVKDDLEAMAEKLIA